MPVDRLIGLLAGAQDGVVEHGQLVALGIGRRAISRRVARGLLHPQHRGVYLWGNPQPTSEGRLRAAVLACGPRAYVSHHAAAARWGIRPAIAADAPVDVTVVGRRVRRAGLRTHEAGVLLPEDARVVRGIALTSVAKTLLDIAPDLPEERLAHAIEQAQIRRLVTKRDLARAIARAPRRPGVPALRALVEERAFTRSMAERRIVALLRAAKLPLPVFNAVIEGFEVDVLWRREGLVLEFDSYAFHATRAAFERDRRRDAALTRARCLVMRTTWRELHDESHALIARVAEALALRRGTCE